MRGTCASPAKRNHRPAKKSLGTVEQLRAVDLALLNAGCNAGLGVGLQVHCPTLAFHLLATDRRLQNESELAEEERISQLLFGLEGMETYYLSFKEKRAMTEETIFNVDSFKDDFPDSGKQFEIWDCESFTQPLDPYFPEFVWEFYTFYGARQDLLKYKGRVDLIPCLSSMLVWG
ncbi:hypothetical protein HAX54_042529 [Datura stramonium]|uniref:Uncharacterized protein n=1 Tax=Datura stramonium TaxID=4076 RepID=A0ABS8W483_DATST|nr:hypothetical protein [Datura stramonium]